MGFIQQVKNWTDAHNPKWLALIRVALGGALLLSGVNFLNDLPGLDRLIEENGLSAYGDLIRNSVPWIHVAGGFLIIIGLFTRFAAFIQVPILVGAVLFINSKKGFFGVQTDLVYSIILLVLLFVFVIEGSGPLSLSTFFKEVEAEAASEKRANA
jgi:putative oxidoreductase